MNCGMILKLVVLDLELFSLIYYFLLGRFEVLENILNLFLIF